MDERRNTESRDPRDGQNHTGGNEPFYTRRDPFDPIPVAPKKTERKPKSTSGSTSDLAAALASTKSESAPAMAGVAQVKIGRNDPCPCGSGKKYKKCHGKS